VPSRQALAVARPGCRAGRNHRAFTGTTRHESRMSILRSCDLAAASLGACKPTRDVPAARPHGESLRSSSAAVPSTPRSWRPHLNPVSPSGRRISSAPSLLSLYTCASLLSGAGGRPADPPAARSQTSLIAPRLMATGSLQQANQLHRRPRSARLQLFPRARRRPPFASGSSRSW
jgi:hypothetical protein